MLTSKQRAFLRGQANKQDSIFQVGKGSVSQEMAEQISKALKKRELVKLSVLQNCEHDVHTVSQEIAQLTNSEVVACIGKKVILYKENPQQRVYDIRKI